MRRLLFLLVLLFPAPALAHAPRPHVPIDLHFGNCPGIEDEQVLGCTFQQPAGVWHIYQTDHDELTFPHEAGHVYDATEMAETDREAFKRIFGLQKYGWWSQFGLDSATAGEWFAEGYARCELHSPAGVSTAYDYAPSKAQHRAVCRVIWIADKTRGNGG